MMIMGCLTTSTSANPSTTLLPSPVTPLILSPAHSRRRKLLVAAGVSPVKGLRWRNVGRRNTVSVVSFASSQEDSKPSEGEIEVENKVLKQDGKASQEAWQQALASFKEQALKLQSVSEDAYEVYSKKAVVVLHETSKKLKIQADQARQDLSVLAKELSENGRQYLTDAAENAPEPVKDVVETFASTDNFDDVSEVRDFYIGIPYGTILSAGGFLNFMLTGSVSAIRFGVILGGVLLALSVSSLKSWKKGESTEMALKGQTAITSILFLRDTSLLFQGFTPVGLIKTIISGAVAAFFIYRITYDKLQGRPNVDGEASS